MFTGIIQAIGKVREPEKLGNGVLPISGLIRSVSANRSP